MAVLDNLQPKEVFKYFEQISNIPHGSGNTDMISDYLVDFAKERDLRYIQDKVGNIIIFKAGTAGYENSAPVIIQGHMDMVCEKTGDCTINLETDGLKLMTDGEKVWAEGTTLGGDDGIAVAIALAILDAPEGTIAHPPLEIVITVDEEIGMLGADFIDCSPLKAKTMLNLDSEDEGVLLVSCAGGGTAACHIELDTEELNASDDGKLVRLVVNGATGGHSGVEIIRQRANASKVLGRVLSHIVSETDIRLVDICGGSKDNAIPRSASALLYVEDKSSLDKAISLTYEWNRIIYNEYQATDPEISVVMILPDGDKAINTDSEDVLARAFEKLKNSNKISVITKNSVDTVISAIVLSPNGVRRMSNDIEGMVQTSLNLGIMKLMLKDDGKKELVLSFCVRSSVMSEKEELYSELEILMRTLRGRLEISGNYPAWEYRKESRLRELMIERFKALYGREPVVEALHAGVECGLFAGKIENLDCVSFGPDMVGIHTTAEIIYVDSVKRTYEYTLDILENLK